MGQSNYKPVFAAWKKKLAKSPLEIRKGIARDLTEEIVYGTPRDTGQTRRNWVASNGAPVIKITEDTDYNGTQTVNDAKKVIDQMKIGVRFYLVNSVPWIRKLELGSSQQAPHGWIFLAKAKLGLVAKRWFKIELG